MIQIAVEPEYVGRGVGGRLLAHALLRTIPGFVSAAILRRRAYEGVEFLIVTQWSSVEAIRRFAGDEAKTAVVPFEVQDMMLEYDHLVRHYEVVALSDPYGTGHLP